MHLPLSLDKTHSETDNYSWCFGFKDFLPLFIAKLTKLDKSQVKVRELSCGVLPMIYPVLKQVPAGT